MFRIMRAHRSPIAIGRYTGTFDRDQAVRELDRAYRTGDLESGLTSVVYIDPGFDSHSVTVADLAELTAHVAAKEACADAEQDYVSIIVADTHAGRVFASVVHATWRTIPHMAPEQLILPSLEAAEQHLAVSGLSDELEALAYADSVAYFNG